MKIRILLGLLVLTIILLPVLTACNDTEKAQTSTSRSGGANWWDNFGEPQYGGTLTIGTNWLNESWDIYYPATANFFPYEQLFMADLTMDRDEWSFQTQGKAPKNVGLLAESWEWSDPQTLIVNLRQDVYWQDKQPTYGREFTADDVVYHFDRVLGTGSGFTEPNPSCRGYIAPIISVKALDKYSVAIGFKDPTKMMNWWAAIDSHPVNMIEPREFVESDVTDYRNAAGTGAYMITDFVSGSYLTLSKNSNYYDYDERYPDNKLPYIDTIKILQISDTSSQLAALRSSRIDLLQSLDWQVGENLRDSNPELVIETRPFNGFCFDFRCNNKPFADIRVRQALQLAINIPQIAESHYGGKVSSDPPPFLSAAYGDWALLYDQWPEDLKDEYSYNPERAKELLLEAGYPDGFETYVYMPTEQDVFLAQIIKSYFADINVDMDINTLDSAQFIQYSQAGKIDQLGYFQASNVTSWPANIAFFMRTSMSPQSVNAPAEEVASYEELYQQFIEASDEAEMKQIGYQMQEYALRMHWGLVTTGRVYYDVFQPRLEGCSGEDMTGWNRVWFWTRLWLVD